MNIQILALVAFLLVAGTSAAADSEVNVKNQKFQEAFYLKTAQDLKTLCSTDKEYQLHDKAMGFCYGFMSGTMSFYGAIKENPNISKLVCSDSPISRSQMVTTFLEWAENNPDRLSQPAVDSLMQAASEKWPCHESEIAMNR
ncbi:Rap1a/Tai family immunity protein [Desulfogranum japonicum]|uniref:Rap1a/Tai family immunity protein n=1 Tax=Desulfogranum japonicum TaxID=231447 RepID=UPI000427E5A1|nr:Rap1a/Tai family immunity protein [Desulfogranum japonicum]